jgi:hypothetical protein
MTSIQERNRQILQMRRAGVSRKEVASRFKLSRSRIQLIERQDAAERSLADRQAKLREDIRAADDPERLWPVNDLVDGLGLIVVTRKRLIDHFMKVGKQQISLKKLMDMCMDAPVEGFDDFMMSPLLMVCGVGKKGFWSVVNGLTGMDLGSRCNEERRKHLFKIQQEHW